jgi:putative aldouronate transport system substrate-binding protein
MDTQPANTWEQVRGQNQRAVSSAVFGFSMDISGLRSEIAACNAVKARYAVDLVYGPEEPEVSIPRMMAELRAAGLDRIAAEAQRQIDVFFK